MDFKIVNRFVLVFAASLGVTGSQAADPPPFTSTQLCRAGIAVAMSRSPSIVRLDRIQGDVIFLSYVADGTKWGFKCQVEGERITWGADDGRWRTHPLDGTITFEATKSGLTISERHSDGSVTRRTFQRGQLGK